MLNPKSLSLAAGVNETYVRDILKGKSVNPRMEQLGKLAAKLGCTAEDLMKDADPAYTARSVVTEPDLPPDTPDQGVGVAEFGAKALMGGAGLDDEERRVAGWRFPSDWLRHELRGDVKTTRHPDR